MSRRDIPLGCRPFNLEAAKEGAPLRTRDGRPASLIHIISDKHVEYPVIAIVDDEPRSFTSQGVYLSPAESEFDLFIVDLSSHGLSEFEDKLSNIIQSAVNLSDRSELTMEHVRQCAAELLQIAFREFTEKNTSSQSNP